MNPKYPIYIVSKGRWDSRLTSKALESMNVPYFIVVEEQEYKEFANVIDKKKILILDKQYQADYDTCDDLGDSKSKGPGAARNFAWEHSINNGFDWHWVMDDNIRFFSRRNCNLKIPVGDGTIFKIAEDFCDRYENIAMSGFNYFMFPRNCSELPPFHLNTRIYSCNLIKNNLPHRWRGRYNEDTDLSLQMLKDGWCTVLFNAFLCFKMTTQTVKGGNSKEFYDDEGTLNKSKMQVKLHPDVSKLAWKWGRWHHHVDYKPFIKKNKLKLKPGIKIKQGIDNYGMELQILKENKWTKMNF